MLAVSTICEAYRGNESLVPDTNRYRLDLRLALSGRRFGARSALARRNILHLTEAQAQVRPKPHAKPLVPRIDASGREGEDFSPSSEKDRCLERVKTALADALCHVFRAYVVHLVVFDARVLAA